jgi:hypothetical protein
MFPHALGLILKAHGVGLKSYANGMGCVQPSRQELPRAAKSRKRREATHWLQRLSAIGQFSSAHSLYQNLTSVLRRHHHGTNWSIVCFRPAAQPLPARVCFGPPESAYSLKAFARSAAPFHSVLIPMYLLV